MREFVANTNPAINQINQIDNILTKLDENSKNNSKAPQICFNIPNKTIKIIVEISLQLKSININKIETFTLTMAT